MTLELVAALAKLLIYAAALAGAGTALAWASLRDALGNLPNEAPRRIGWSAAVAAASALAALAILVARLGSGFDPSLLGAALGGFAGLAFAAQIAGAALLGAAAGGTARRPLRLTGAALLLASFGITGHAAASGAATGLLAAVHVAAAAWWLGSLLLIRSACATQDSRALAALVRIFARAALFVVGAMVVAGVVVAAALVSPWRHDWLTPYAKNLLLKVSGAGAALALAAYNRFRLVPLLEDPGGTATGRLRRSVTAEIALLGAVLLATAWLTTFHSPHEAH
ncbi:MAG TPA: CopD family protein [Thermoanaerobaculia bacterium]|nr:CopD family protein [Thermoanaerobaculia bacterium]